MLTRHHRHTYTYININTGKFINAFKAKDLDVIALMKSRARMKMYAPNTPHASGPRPHLYKKEEKKMLYIGSRVDGMVDKLFHQDFRLNEEAEPDDLEDGEVHESKMIERIDADVTCAFVTFQYAESMARCVEDYSRWNWFPLNQIYFPKELKLNGIHSLTVTHAPEPDELIWEHLDVTWLSHQLRKIFTVIVAIVAISSSFVIVLQAAKYKGEFAKDVPRLQSCSTGRYMCMYVCMYV